MRVLWTEAPIKDLEQIDKPVVRRILRRIAWFAGNFEKVTAEPLAGDLKGMFKLRIGNWRFVYSIEGKTIMIQFVGHRGEIYKTR